VLCRQSLMYPPRAADARAFGIANTRDDEHDIRTCAGVLVMRRADWTLVDRGGQGQRRDAGLSATRVRGHEVCGQPTRNDHGRSLVLHRAGRSPAAPRLQNGGAAMGSARPADRHEIRPYFADRAAEVDSDGDVRAGLRWLGSRDLPWEGSMRSCDQGMISSPPGRVSCRRTCCSWHSGPAPAGRGERATLRLAAMRPAAEAVRLETAACGGAGYHGDTATSRRIREAASCRSRRPPKPSSVPRSKPRGTDRVPGILAARPRDSRRTTARRPVGKGLRHSVCRWRHPPWNC
jgi:hypothetical protein